MACVACHNAKRKCSYSNGQNKCDRCTKHGIDCNERESNQGQRTDLLNKRDRSPFDDSDSDSDVDVMIVRQRGYVPILKYKTSVSVVSRTHYPVELIYLVQYAVEILFLMVVCAM